MLNEPKLKSRRKSTYKSRVKNKSRDFKKLKLRSEKDFIAYKNGKRVYDVDLYISPSRWDNSNKNRYHVYVSHRNAGRVYSSEILGTPQLNYESTTNKLTYIWEGEYELKNGSKT